MRLPSHITFTGVDERTDLTRMEKLSERYPIEWGVLFSLDRQGEDPRYPSRRVIDNIRAAKALKAAHLCGAYARDVFTGLGCWASLNRFGRIQVNHARPDVQRVAEFSQSWRARGIMFDCSGGRGAEPEQWPSYPGWLVGYAGGIGPDNVQQVIQAIGADGPYWIDMESRIRTDDWLDLDKCEAILEAVYGDGNV